MAKLSFADRRLLDKLFVHFGYVLDFSNATFSDFFESEVGVDIYDARYEVNGTSKGNRLRAFLQLDDAETVARALRALWEYRRDNLGSAPDPADYEPRMMKVIYELSPSDASQKAVPSPVVVTEPDAEVEKGAVAPAVSGATSALASYAHQDDVYNLRVRDQVNRLRSDGVDCWIDQFEAFPKAGWPLWMERQVAERQWIWYSQVKRTSVERMGKRSLIAALA